MTPVSTAGETAVHQRTDGFHGRSAPDSFTVLTVHRGERAAELAADLGYLHALGAHRVAGAPAAEPDAAGDAAARIAADAVRPGFLAVTVRVGGRLCGFGTALECTGDFAYDRLFSAAAEAWGVRRAAQCLAGALRVHDLTVAPQARGRGLGALLVDRLADAALEDRIWVRVPDDAPMAARFFRARGWHAAAPPRPAGEDRDLRVLLGPRHPAAFGAHA
jgi:GNAT superfamily N-acetyltransferase